MRIQTPEFNVIHHGIRAAEILRDRLNDAVEQAIQGIIKQKDRADDHHGKHKNNHIAGCGFCHRKVHHCCTPVSFRRVPQFRQYSAAVVCGFPHSGQFHA